MDNHTEENLDPLDWEKTRLLAHRMVDDMVDYLRDVRERPVWQATPAAVDCRCSGQMAG